MQLPLDTSRIRVEFEEHPGYLHVHILGEYQFEEFRIGMHAVHSACVERGVRRAVLDITAMTGEIPQFDRYNLGIEFADIWRRETKAAVLAPAAIINRFFENTAVNRQARVKIFADLQSALLWLMQP